MLNNKVTNGNKNLGVEVQVQHPQVLVVMLDELVHLELVGLALELLLVILLLVGPPNIVSTVSMLLLLRLMLLLLVVVVPPGFH